MVGLDSGETLIALRQNQETVEEGTQLALGARVQATWLEAQTFTINKPSA